MAFLERRSAVFLHTFLVVLYKFVVPDRTKNTEFRTQLYSVQETCSDGNKTKMLMLVLAVDSNVFNVFHKSDLQKSALWGL